MRRGSLLFRIQGCSGVLTIQYSSASFVPPSPSIFYGCSVEVNHVVELVLKHAPARIAIVGPGGIGKTSIALTSIHDSEVEKYFLGRHFFLACEAATTADILALALLKLFGLSADSSGSRSPTDILVSFAQSMTSRCLLCLDNFETPWDCDKDNVESLLSSIVVPNLTLIITSRDSDRPRGIKWTAPLLLPIKPLTVAAAVETWDAIVHSHDDFSLLLINAVDCIPLAVTLLAQLAEIDSSEVLWASWGIESTRLVKSEGSAHRLNNLELSIELSLHGPRLRGCPGSLDFFVTLCMLPQGLRESRISEFEMAFRNSFEGTHSAIRMLKQCSLAYSIEGFLRVLSPVRQYTHGHLNPATTLATTLFTQMADIYFNLISTDHPSYISNMVLEDIYLEIGNITSVLDASLARYPDVACAIQKVIQFSEKCQYLGVYDTRLLSQAASIARDKSLSKLEGDCYQTHGLISHYSDRLLDAEEMLKAALEMHMEGDDKQGQANDLHRLGNLYLRLSQVEEAEKALKAALELHTEVNNKLGQANDLQSLGDLYMRLDQVEEAEKALKAALELHTELNHKLGQANDLRSLGDLYLRLDQVEEAEKALEAALELHIEVNHKLGQANDLRSLGDLYLRLDKAEEAEKALKAALELHTEVNHKLGQANDLQSIGDLYLRLDQVEEAEKALKVALELSIETKSSLEQGNALKSLGNLCINQSTFTEAQEFLTRAIDKYEHALHSGGQRQVEALLQLLQEKQTIQEPQAIPNKHTT
ncbi:hypothetical protein DFH08DRAFT_725292 [Mycena albidolilacea]|uniref:TPR-like protein n=1 Tax=Mycena albidolilacea TaxID=1033008 RepID=A0AAD7E667_9AGAR|nr:hypothetical protein DFH08DRAFT_725292 [Mycena albidolilacea]